MTLLFLLSAGLFSEGEWVLQKPKDSLYEYLQSVDPGKPIKSMKIPEDDSFPPRIWAEALDFPDLRHVFNVEEQNFKNQTFRITYVTDEYMSVTTIVFRDSTFSISAQVTNESPGSLETKAMWHRDWKSRLQKFQVAHMEKHLTNNQGKRFLRLLAKMDFFSFPDFDSIPREIDLDYVHPNTCIIEGYKNGHYHLVDYLDDPELESKYDIQFRDLLHYVAKLSKQPWILEGERGSHMKAFEAN